MSNCSTVLLYYLLNTVIQYPILFVNTFFEFFQKNIRKGSSSTKKRGFRRVITNNQNYLNYREIPPLLAGEQWKQAEFRLNRTFAVSDGRVLISTAEQEGRKQGWFRLKSHFATPDGIIVSLGRIPSCLLQNTAEIIPSDLVFWRFRRNRLCFHPCQRRDYKKEFRLNRTFFVSDGIAPASNLDSQLA